MAGYVPSKHGPKVVNAVANTYEDSIASDGTNEHIIRTISLVNTGASVRKVTVTIGAGAAATEIIEQSIPANSTMVFNGWWHVPTSTAVQTKQDAGTDCTITLSGYHYT